MVEGIIAAVIGILAGVGGTTVYTRTKVAGGKHKADQLLADAKTKASNIALKAKDEVLKLVEDAKKEETPQLPLLKKGDAVENMDGK